MNQPQPRNHHALAMQPTAGLVRQCLHAFQQLLGQTQLKLALQTAPLGWYDRIFSPVVTLWCMIFQRLNHDHTLQAAVTHLHLGGADRLAPRQKAPLSKRIISLATTAFSNARQRLPFALFPAVLAAQSQAVWNETSDGLWLGWRVWLLDGSQIAWRPYPEILTRLEASSNQNGKAYWVLMRVVATFCWYTGVVVASTTDSCRVSEQELACRQIRTDSGRRLYLGDRNFGVFQVVQCVLAANAHCLFRLTQSRARKLAGSARRICRCGDYPIGWQPSQHDLGHANCRHQVIPGRLLVAQSKRPGFRTQWIYLFTTLTDAEAYATEPLLNLYATRWQIELNLRYLKTQMNLNQIDCKSADMAEKEWMAGLLAYNLVRAVMLSAALQKGTQPSRLSFSATRRWLVQWLVASSTGTKIVSSWESLLNRVAQIRQPNRSQPRPSEPRAKRHKRETFPPLRGCRLVARKNLKTFTSKS